MGVGSNGNHSFRLHAPGHTTKFTLMMTCSQQSNHSNQPFLNLSAIATVILFARSLKGAFVRKSTFVHFSLSDSCDPNRFCACQRTQHPHTYAHAHHPSNPHPPYICIRVLHTRPPPLNLTFPSPSSPLPSTLVLSLPKPTPSYYSV